MTIKDSAGQAGTYAKDKAAAAKLAASDAYANARDKAGELAGTARDAASQARMKTADGIDANPVAALLGGLALGALAAAVLPRTRREDELLGNVGGRINDSARDAVEAAKVAGRDKLDELGINKDAAIDKAKELAQSVAGVARESATAAASSVKGR